MGTRRSKDERLAALDAKIDYHHELIAKLLEKKNKITEPAKRNVRKMSMHKALFFIKESGLTPDEIVAMVEKKKKKAANDSMNDMVSEQAI